MGGYWKLYHCKLLNMWRMIFKVLVFCCFIVGVFLVTVGCSLASHSPPGTSSRPILTSSEAGSFTKAAYLQGWTPPTISTSQADYIVGSGHYSTIQAAVNAAIKAGGTTRKYIKIGSGTYKEVVYIPSTNVPLTLYGAGSTSSETTITLSLPASTTAAQYKSLVNPNGAIFKSGDPAYSMYENCAKTTGTIGTGCSSVFMVKASKVQIVNLTIQNSSKDGQAVALGVTADEVQVDNTRLLGHQDTFYSGSGGNNVQRSIISKTYIQGDTDFVFGGGSTIFQYCVFRVMSDRRSDGGTIFAPSTDPHKKYGFLVIGSTITGDSVWFSSKSVHLARSWDMGVTSASAYVPGTSPNGQLVIRETTIDLIIPTSAPYTKAATSGRVYSGNASSNRNLDDNNHNRFWEYANKGDGA